ncbi:PEROXIDASE [Salix purpurea]|uniref:peroxidase n=1 Tax=Salix purpurea TaxID=77065 RepID=A0A9Q0ZAL7_SALPP|nr:PEROXIDASE [Salix purpurea]
MSQVDGPSYAVKLGRRDSTTASRTLANAELPSFSEGLESLISCFQKKGLTARDMVALSRSHTQGQAQCFTFRERIYNQSNIDAGFASTRRRRCSRVGNDATLAPLDLVTPNSFDNNYFKNLKHNKGLLQSDQVLFNGGSTDSIVSEYSRNPAKFSSDFGSAMIKMGDVGLLTGSSGQIRRICSHNQIQFSNDLHPQRHFRKQFGRPDTLQFVRSFSHLLFPGIHIWRKHGLDKVEEWGGESVNEILSI